MRRLLMVTLALVVVCLCVSSPVWARTLKFQLLGEADLNGVHLLSGSYKLEVNGEEAKVLRNGDLVVEARVEVHPLEEGCPPNSVKIEAGEIREIRFKKECVKIVG